MVQKRNERKCPCDYLLISQKRWGGSGFSWRDDVGPVDVEKEVLRQPLKMQKRWQVAGTMGLLWAASIMYGEVLSYWLPVWTCPWPPLASNGTVEDPLMKPIRVAVIADPQLTDLTSYGMKPGSLALRLTQFYSDIYMRRAFRSSVLGMNPDQIIFLGDLFDGGPYLSREEWQESLKRFELIFDQSEGGIEHRRTRPTIPVYTLPGNHDLGYEAVEASKPEVVERYKEVFGDLDHNVTIGGIEFIFVDAQALDGSGDGAERSWNFVQRKSMEDKPHVRVLVTHIPLYRPDETPCGVHRASPIINQRIRSSQLQPHRIIYQDYLTEASSTKLLDAIKPVMVLSGHDHDQCYIVHKTKQGSVPEHTVGTFSWQQGNHYPSLMLLSVTPDASVAPRAERVVASHLCFLPVQLVIYVWYGILLAVTLLVLILWPSQGLELRWFSQQTQALIAELMQSHSAGGFKAKDEDSEWEMVWDAEGAMHLINKGPKAVPLKVDSTSTSGKRGNVARRTGHEADTDTVVNLHLDSSNLSQAPGTFLRRVRTRTRPFSMRVVQSLGPIAVLAALNSSFYVLLLIKDWGPL